MAFAPALGAVAVFWAALVVANAPTTTMATSKRPIAFAFRNERTERPGLSVARSGAGLLGWVVRDA